MKREPGVTSAADLLPTTPAARPEPVAPKASSQKDDAASFAEVLQSETAEPASQTSSEPETDVPTDAATVVAQAVPVATPVPVTPAATSPEAILAGLTLDQPAPGAALEGNAEAPAIDTSPQPAPQQSATAPAATSPVPAAATAPVQAAAATSAAPKPAAPAATSDSTAEADDSAGDETATSVSAAPATPVDAITVAAVTPVAAPVAQPPATPEPQADPLSAPGAERAATASVETAAPVDGKSTAASSNAAAKTQGAATRTAAGPTPNAEAALDIKMDAATQPATSAGADVLATARPTATTTTQHAAQTQPALQNAPPATVQVYQRMIERFDGRAQRYEIRLDPAELGRVDVRIEVGADKKVHAVLAAHDSAALTDLMRGQRSLERALSDAGVDVADGGIKFELSNQNNNSAGDQNASERNASANVWRGFSSLNVAVDAQTAAAARPWRPSSRLDLVA